MINTIICQYCNKPHTYERKPGPIRKYCSDAHKDAAKRGKPKPLRLVHTESVELRPLEVMRATGLTFDERRLLRERRSAIQILKERLANRIERAL